MSVHFYVIIAVQFIIFMTDSESTIALCLCFFCTFVPLCFLYHLWWREVFNYNRFGAQK